MNYLIEKAMAGESVSDMADVKVQIEEERFQATLPVRACRVVFVRVSVVLCALGS